MLIVGLTGNIAAGKSAVASRLAALGAPVIDADLLARAAVDPGTPALARIVERWGHQMLTAGGMLDRAALRRIVFSDATERAALDAIVHPEIARLREERTAEQRGRGAPLVICDIPLLFEAGLESTVDLVVLVNAPDAVRRARLIGDRGCAPDEANAMMAAQMPAARKRTRAHHIIENDASLAELDANVLTLHEALLRASRTQA